MTKEILQQLIDKNLSTHKIAVELKIGQTSVRYWLKKFGLKTLRLKQDEIKLGFKTCPQCKLKLTLKENFYISKSGKIHGWCKLCNDRISYDKQIALKNKCVIYKGGKCCICGYNRYFGALDFHHTNPTEKDFAISELRTYTWKIIKDELDKCICVCKNCHAEIHFGLILDGPIGKS